MTPDINSRARALVRQLFGEPSAWPQPQPDRDYETLVEAVAIALRQLAAEAREAALREAAKVALIHCEPFIATTILALIQEPPDSHREAVATAASLRALLAEAGEALNRDQTAIKEILRYLEGGETKGSYDGKPERRGLRAAQSTNEAARTSIQSALRDASPTTGKPE